MNHSIGSQFKKIGSTKHFEQQVDYCQITNISSYLSLLVLFNLMLEDPRGLPMSIIDLSAYTSK